ncbi:MAG: DUF1080 domain-containing protein [Isosphaeraceae bacterium]|nr:DUF1080 domain-containing protein [Isosphaeraceae bacterium]
METTGRTGPSPRPFHLFGRFGAVAATWAALVLAAGAGEKDRDRAGGKPAALVLFDGKGLEGWKKTDFANPGDVKVEDGAIVLSTGRAMTGITSTRADLPRKDYELNYEAQRLSGRDFFAAATFPVGDSYLTFVNGGWGGSVTGLSSLDGADASENETSRFVKYEDKTWYKFRVRVTGTTVRCWVDDKEVAAVNYQDRKVGTRIESRSCQPLGFATWDTGGALRKIEVRRLTPAEVASNHKPQE